MQDFNFTANLSRMSNAKTRSLSAENPTGEPGKGAMAETGMGANAARELGRGRKIAPAIQAQPGETVTIADIKGEGMIQSIWFAGSSERSLIFRVYWDGCEKPSIEAPLPSFFAFGYNNNVDSATGRFPFLNSALIMVAPNRGFNCYFEMPFRKGFRMTLENTGCKKTTSYYQINYCLTQVPDDCGYFCAQYRQAKPLTAGADYLVADGIKGKGQYIGTSMAVGLNGEGNWWGEGEIKFFMDGDTEFPTICGTGTEDYFCGAYNWDLNGAYQTYSGLYAGMFQVVKPDGLYSCQQRFSLYRWHVVDPIRFEKDLRITLQDLGWRSDGRYLERRDDFMSVAYYYLDRPEQNLPAYPTPNEIEAI